MEQEIVKCPKCGVEIGEVEFYRYYRRCKTCWNSYCREHRYPNREVNRRAVEKFRAAHPVLERHCKKCNLTKSIENFEPKKHFCKDCYRTPNEIKKAYQLANPEQARKFKKDWYSKNKHRFISDKKVKIIFSELKMIAQKAVSLNESYNFDDAIDNRPFLF